MSILIQTILWCLLALVIGLIAGGIGGYMVGFDIGWRARPEDEAALEELSSEADPTIPNEMGSMLRPTKPWPRKQQDLKD